MLALAMAESPEETMIEACGAPWNHTQQQLVSRKQRRRLPPHRGIEQLALEPGAAAPRSPSQQAASDPTATSQYELSVNPDDDDDDNGGDDEGPGEGTKRKAPSAGSGTNQSEEMIPDSEHEPSPTSPTKRGAEAKGSNEPAPSKLRTEEPPAVVEERAGARFENTRTFHNKLSLNAVENNMISCFVVKRV